MSARKLQINEVVSMRKVMLLIAILSLGTLCWAGTAREDATERLDNAANVLHEIMGYTTLRASL
jgi:hypothetical protein